MRSKIIAAASAFPTNCYKNSDFIEKFKIESTSEWIESMTGIVQRYFVQDFREFEQIVVQAANDVLGKVENRLKTDNLDAVIVASSTSCYHFPGLSQIVHRALGLKKSVRTIDTNAACNGFMHALSIADLLITANQAENVLVIGADANSTILDMTDRATCCLFGDGAGAVLVRADKKQPGSSPIIAWEHVTISENYEALTAQKHIIMNGRVVFENSIKTFEELIKKVLEKGGLEMADIDLFILHQANYRIFQSLCKKMGCDESKFPFLARDFANTSAATIPICLSKIDFLNKNIVLAGFGAGFVGSASLLSYK